MVAMSIKRWLRWLISLAHPSLAVPRSRLTALLALSKLKMSTLTKRAFKPLLKAVACWYRFKAQVNQVKGY